MGAYDKMYDRPISVGTAIGGIITAARDGDGHEVRECLSAAVEKAERDYGTNSAAYIVLLAVMDSL